MRIPLLDGAWLDHDPTYLPGVDADRAHAAVRAELTWEQREIVLFGRRVWQPRLIAWTGTLPYRYSGQTLPPRAAPPVVHQLLADVCTRAGVAFNHVLVNRYRDGQDSMGLHADDEPELGEDPIVATLSLGTARRFVLQPRRRGTDRVILTLTHGSLLVMGGATQHHWYHAVPKAPACRDARINVTFRWLHGPPGWRPRSPSS